MNETSSRLVEEEFDTTRLFPRRTAAFLNLWYRTYDEAKAALTEHPDRFLFPYQTQFVVCEGSMLEFLSIDTNDPDWNRIGHDWLSDDDSSAHNGLASRLREVLKEPAMASPRLIGRRTVPRT